MAILYYDEKKLFQLNTENTTMVVPRNKKKQFEIVRKLRTICL